MQIHLHTIISKDLNFNKYMQDLPFLLVFITEVEKTRGMKNEFH